MNEKDEKKRVLRLTTRAIAFAAASVAGVFVATLMGFSGGQFYFNLGDSVILMVSALFGPVVGMIAGGVGSFLADLTVYPTTMLFTLVIKGLEGLVSGLFFLFIRKKITRKSVSWVLYAVAMVLSTLLMAAGYFLCQTLFYGTKASALVALPMDLVQAAVSSVVAFTLLLPCKVIRFRDKLALATFRRRDEKKEKEEDGAGD